MFSYNFNKKGLAVSLVSRFWGHDGAYESNHFLEQRRRMMTITTSTCNKTMKVKRPREGGFCVIIFGFYFVVCLFFLYIFVNPINFFITKNLVITYKLNTIKGFCHKKKYFATVLVFLNFCHNFRKIKNDKERNKNQRMRCKFEHVIV
jgi:hypothetical protein